MTARCQLCGEVIQGRYVENATPTALTPEQEEQQKLWAYDSLSASFWLHISDNHREQMEEGMLVQRRAAKLYAMNWADHADEMIPVKQQWRQHMLIAMSVTTRRVGDAPPDQAATPEASNAKKSERNASS